MSADARVFRLQLALGAGGLVAVSFVLAVAVRAVHVRPAAAHRLHVGALTFSYPAVNAAAAVLLALAVFGAVVLIAVAGAACGQVRAHRRFLRGLPVEGVLSGEPGPVLIDARAPLAFCAGWLRPRVYVSRGALERLGPDELRAVLAHEEHHRAVRDPLRLAVGRVLAQALFFLPALRPLHAHCGDVAERRADAAAVAASGGARGPLAAALLTLGATPSGDAVGISPDRVDALFGRASPWRLPRGPLVVGLVALATAIALAWRASAGATLQATLALPIASSQPCVLVLALVPVVAALARTLIRATT